MLFDTHAHLTDEQFDKDREEVIKRAKDSGVEYILAVSADVATSVESVTLAQKHDFIYAAVGVHPHSAVDLSNNVISLLSDFATYRKVVAIGEIGLDYHYENSPREAQKIWFAKQISLAKGLNLPILIHDREAHEDTLRILKDEGAKQVGGILHCFSGSVEMAREVMNMNFMISFAGSVTFKNARRLVEVAKYVPDDMMVIETDCPYLAPEPHRGTRNEPSYVRKVAEKIAEIKGKPVEYIEQITTENAKKILKIK